MFNLFKFQNVNILYFGLLISFEFMNSNPKTLVFELQNVNIWIHLIKFESENIDVQIVQFEFEFQISHVVVVDDNEDVRIERCWHSNFKFVNVQTKSNPNSNLEDIFQIRVWESNHRNPERCCWHSRLEFITETVKILYFHD